MGKKVGTHEIIEVVSGFPLEYTAHKKTAIYSCTWQCLSCSLSNLGGADMDRGTSETAYYRGPHKRCGRLFNNKHILNHYSEPLLLATLKPAGVA